MPRSEEGQSGDSCSEEPETAALRSTVSVPDGEAGKHSKQQIQYVYIR